MCVQAKRGQGLKLVVMSATLDAAKFVEYFPGSKAAYLQARHANHLPIGRRQSQDRHSLRPPESTPTEALQPSCQQ